MVHQQRLKAVEDHAQKDRVRLYGEDDPVKKRLHTGTSRRKPTLWCHSTVFQKLLALSGY
ncbi:hypothetical protein ES332_A09G120200v1 [Gossypium tomentosum]|uniref:Uncharacterized protein n=1 Tax=Gossypium tomentosum TaxID=34277 RepID=A0A5D2P1I4_GOSTO|nr:hypothetical protein ES332_A09G120200v1 [Gossypium tomentosum]